MQETENIHDAESKIKRLILITRSFLEALLTLRPTESEVEWDVDNKSCY